MHSFRRDSHGDYESNSLRSIKPRSVIGSYETGKPLSDGHNFSSKDLSRLDPYHSRYESHHRSRSHSNHRTSPKYFKDLVVRDDILKGLDLINIKKLNDLQRSVLPTLLSTGDDVFVQSRPYSGKTTAYLIAALNRINTKVDKIQVLILLPTSELVLKTGELAKKIAKFTRITIRCLTRDTNQDFSRYSAFKEHVLIISTGSYLFLKRDRDFDRSKINLIIFNELEVLTCSDSASLKVRKIITSFLNRSQLFFFSNSYGQDSLDFVKRFTGNRILHIDHLDIRECFKKVIQFYIVCRDYTDKYAALANVLKNSRADKILIYALGRSKAFHLYDRLIEDKFRCSVLVSKSSLEERKDVIKTFQNESILVLNYPLTHGIDLDDITLVINFDLFCGRSIYYEYLHKACKTGRFKNTGYIINLVSVEERDSIDDLEHHFGFKMWRLDSKERLNILNYKL